MTESNLRYVGLDVHKRVVEACIVDHNGKIVRRQRFALSRPALLAFERLASVQRWTKTYWDEFIPFAHGVRRLAVYYNDAVRPQDPYEFIGLLQGEDLLATKRNVALRALADRLRQNRPLRDAIHEACDSTRPDAVGWQPDVLTAVRSVPGGEAFLAEFRGTLESVLDLPTAIHALRTGLI